MFGAGRRGASSKWLKRTPASCCSRPRNLDKKTLGFTSQPSTQPGPRLPFERFLSLSVLFASATGFICFYSFALFIYQEITPTTPTTSSALAAAATDLDLEMGGRIASSLGALFSTLSFPANQTSPPPIHPRSSCYLWNNSKKNKKVVKLCSKVL